jgi:molybdenum cofactor cytidylyltransferase
MKFAVLPAAGKSTRMGRPKLSLPLGDSTILAHVVNTLRQAEVEHVVVVVGRHVPELIPLAESSGAYVCPLAEETADMRTTVEHGLRWLEEHFQPHPDDGWLLVPADHPVLSPAVVRELALARQAHPDHSIFVPTHQGQRGHPLLLTWRHVESLRAYPADQGLNRYVRAHDAQTLEVEVATSDILRDLDTPEDYECLLRQWSS